MKVETRTKDKNRFKDPYKIEEQIYIKGYRLKHQNGGTTERSVEKTKKFLKREV